MQPILVRICKNSQNISSHSDNSQSLRRQLNELFALKYSCKHHLFVLFKICEKGENIFKSFEFFQMRLFANFAILLSVECLTLERNAASSMLQRNRRANERLGASEVNL